MNDPDPRPTGPGADSLAELQRRRNQQSRDRWELFAPHRHRVTELLLRMLAAAPGEQRPSLCLLGAGNCNDVDLRQLRDAGAEIHLADVDQDALRQATTRQNVPANLLEFDVTGVLHELSQPGALSDADRRRELMQGIAAGPPALPGRFDVVASLNLLTQLVDLALHAAEGLADDAFTQAALAMQRRHLLLLRQLRNQGGATLLITDVVSSLTCPDLDQIPPPQLSDYLLRQVLRGNFFTGANPWSLSQRLRELGEDVRQHPAWIWDLGPRRYVVTALESRAAVEVEGG